jgi:glycosyltransferase involved in cell wall biosynthesis
VTEKISILMPFRNAALYLPAALDSVLSQREEDFELIAVDDFSEDNSLEILRQYANKDKRIQLHSNEERGVIGALEKAYKNVSGQLITRFDADDLMPEHKCEELKALLLQAGRGSLSTGRVQYFSDEGLSEGFVNYANWLNALCDNDNHEDQLFKECVIASGNWMAFKEDLDAINAFSDSYYPEDYHLVFKIFEAGYKIVSSKKVTHLWRDHALRASRVSEHYKDQKFYPLKLDFFIKFYGTENINLWGLGASGKRLARELLEREISFHWVTNNEKKIGQSVYGVDVEHFGSLKDRTDEKLIISVTQRGAVEEITHFLDEIDFKKVFEF